MKLKILLTLIATALTFGTAKPVLATNVTYPNPSEIVCVEGQPNIVNNQKFNISFLVYRWHIASQNANTVTYQLQLDINPTQAETWVNVQGHTKVIEIPVCEREVPVEPTPEVPAPHQDVSDGHAPGITTPTCPDGNTVKLPANPHVVRKGADATVNFFLTEGSSANIYYKEVNQSNWQYSVMDLKPNSDNFISLTIHDLKPKEGYTFGIQQKWGCGGGELVTAVIIDGPESQTFRLSYWTF